MASIDQRVVGMTFQSAGFIAGATAVLGALEKLKMGLANLKGGGKTLSDLNAAGQKVDLSGIGKGVDSIAGHFSALGMAATAAFATVISMAAMAGARLIKSLTLTPVMAGLDIYSTKLNAMQTILANTMGQAGSNVGHVTAALNELNTYANQTIYRFGDMAKNIGLFTAAGVKIDTSVASIKGLANIAALSGASTQQAASAMYQLSQAIASGTIRLIDWNSVVNAGMGGKVFQNALTDTARAHGVAIDAMIKKNGSFRESLQEGWLTSQIMTETLSKFTGDLSASQLKAMGYTDAQTKKIMAQAQAAVDAATKVKTISQLNEVMADSIATAWARVWEAVIGNLPQATALLTGVAAGLSKVFVAPITHLGTLLALWSQLGGRAILINALSDAFGSLGSILKTIGSAFRDVFPPMTAQRLVDMTKSFHDFINTLKPSTSALQAIHSIFEGLFSGIKIGLDVFKGIISVIGQVIKALLPAGTTVLGVAGKFGSFVSNLRKSIESGTAFTNFFKTLGTILSAPVKVISAIVQALAGLATGFGHALSALQPFAAKFASWFSNLGSIIANGIRSGDISSIMTVLNQGIFAAVLLAVRHFISNFGKSMSGGFGLTDKIKAIFGGLTSTLQALQANLNAGTLKKIAIALAILTASIVALSLINVASLTKALTAMTVMFGQLAGAMALVSKISPIGIAQMAALGIGLDLLAGAILILSGAVAILARFSWMDLAKGLSAVAVMLGLLVTAAKLLSKEAPGVIAASIAMTFMAVAIDLLAVAVRILAGLSWGDLAKGVVTIAALLAIMAGFNKFGGAQLISTAASMLILGAALNVIALAIRQLGSMGIGQLAKGLLGVAGALIIIAAGMALMPPTMFVTAVSLLGVAVALTILAGALKLMGGMSWEAIGKSLIVLAGSLIILAAAMALMTGALPGAAALLIIAAALTVLTPVLLALGAMSWASLLMSLAALAGIFLVLGAAGLFLGPLVPVLLGLSAALLLFGVAALALGAGVALLGAGLTAIGLAVAASGAAILTFVSGLIGLIPKMLAAVGAGIVAFAGAIAKGGVAITAAFVTILTALLNAVIKVTPIIGRAIQQILTLVINLIMRNAAPAANAMATLIMAVLNAIASRMGQFVQRGSDIIVSFLRGVAANMGRVVSAGVSVAVSFLNGIGANIGRVIDAGVRLVVSTINGMASAIRGQSGALRSAAWGLAGAIIDGLTGGLWSLAGQAISAAASIGSSIISALGKAIAFFSPSHYTWAMGEALADGLTLGLLSKAPDMSKAADKAATTMLTALKNGLEASAIGDITPTITPVLDLSQVKKGFDDVATMARNQISPVSATSAAASISVAGVSSGGEGVVVVAGGTNMTFNQTNTSPKPLQSGDIYRQTKNQISQMRGALPA